MRFDPHSGEFDAEVREALIAVPLPPGADVDLMFLEPLKPLARAYVQTRSMINLKKNQDRAAEEYQKVKDADAVLRERRWLFKQEDRGNTARALIALRPVLRWLHAEWAHWSALVRLEKRGPKREGLKYEIFIAGALQLWIRARGSLDISVEPTTGVAFGPVIAYLRIISLAVTGKTLGPSGLRHLVGRWEKILMPFEPQE
jgi:hypothetical protein